jgi:aminopeptidase 2
MGEVVIMSRLFPEWKPHTSFINDDLEEALELDSKRSSHPIQVECPDANQINQVRLILRDILEVVVNLVGFLCRS